MYDMPARVGFLDSTCCCPHIEISFLQARAASAERMTEENTTEVVVRILRWKVEIPVTPQAMGENLTLCFQPLDE